MQILSTKLSFPPLRTRLVRRSRLFQQLDQDADCGFVLVSAPAGYGKTTLLSAWLRGMNANAAWIALDEGDNDPVRFLAYLAAAIGRVAPEAGQALENSLQVSPLTSTEDLLTPFVNQIAQVGQNFWLVLDDYHAIHNPAIHQITGFLLEYRPAPMRLALATRADPPLPLARLRARCQMVELRLADLRFSAQETAEFFSQVINLRLPEEDLAFLETNTEGWVAGLQMAGLSLQGRKDVSSFIRSFSGENRYVLDFLFEEVFQQQAEEIQNFLLQTAILEQLCCALCNQVTQRTDSQGILDTLARKNLFLIALDEQRQWYRYHHLFSDLLNNRLKHTAPDLIHSLHQRASAWFAAEQDLEHAITHAIAGQDFERVAGLIEQNLPNLDMQNQQAMLASWVNHLPRAILAEHPWLCVRRAWGDYWSGCREDEEIWLQMAEQSIARNMAADQPETRRIRGHIAAIRAHTALVAEDIPRVLEMAQQALNLLPEDDEMRCETAIALGAAYWALGNASQSEKAFGMAKAARMEIKYPAMMVGPICYSGIQQVKQGRLQDALVTFRDGLRLSTLPNGQETPIAGFPNVMLGDIFRERNDLLLAGDHLTRGVKQCLQFVQPDILAYAYACLARYHFAIGASDSVQETLAKADLLAQQKKVDPFTFCWLDEVRLKNWLVMGELEAVRLWEKQCTLKPDEPFRYLHDLHHQNLARAWVAQSLLEGSKDAHDMAADLLARLRDAAQQAGWVHEEIKFLILQAINNQSQGLKPAAVQNLVQALILAAPKGYLRIFLDEGKVIHQLLTDLAAPNCPWVEPEQITPLAPYVASLLAAIKPSQQHPAAPTLAGATEQALVEPLSQREMDVLRLLAQGCSDKQIAETLVIARETVHKHLKNIYGKMDVHSRTAAAARARALGLI